MEFHELKKTELLTIKETRVINKLINQGNKLLDLLNQEFTFEKLRKMVSTYAGIVDKNTELIEGVIERTLNTDTDLSVHINELITNTQELLNYQKRAGIINKYNKVIINRLETMLAKYKIYLKLGYPITFFSKQSRITKQGIILNIAHADISELITLLINANKKEIENNFLITQEVIMQAGIVNDFINNLNKESLKQAINKDSRYAEFLMQIYVMLEQEALKIKNLIDEINNNTIKDSENELSAETEKLRNEVIKLSTELRQALEIIRKAREKGVHTELLISVYTETELSNQTEDFIKSYLRTQTEIKDLTDQLIYEYLSVYDAVPNELTDYTSFKKRSKYYFVKNFFSM